MDDLIEFFDINNKYYGVKPDAIEGINFKNKSIKLIDGSIIQPYLFKLIATEIIERVGNIRNVCIEDEWSKDHLFMIPARGNGKSRYEIVKMCEACGISGEELREIADELYGGTE